MQPRRDAVADEVNRRMNIQEECLQILRALHSGGVDYALCGGLAVAIHGFPRFTQDIDLLIRQDDVEAAKQAVSSVGFRDESGLIRLSDDDLVYRVVKIVGADHLMLDLVLVTPKLQDVWDERIQWDLEGLPIRVVSRRGLIKMKRLAGRPVDLNDLLSLEANPPPDDRTS